MVWLASSSKKDSGAFGWIWTNIRALGFRVELLSGFGFRAFGIYCYILR